MPEKRGTNFAASASSTLCAERHADAAARSRHFVSDLLPAHLADLRENAELVTSELVTNVLVHTDSPATVCAHLDTDCLRVEVYDDCSVLPIGGILDVTGACGRGLVLVERLTHRWGVTRVPGAGKSVWFELVAGLPTPADELTAEDLLDMWDDDLPSMFEVSPQLEDLPQLEDDGRDATARSDEPQMHVSIEDVSTPLLTATKSHLDDLLRDLTLIVEAAAAGDPQDPDVLEVSCRLTAIAVDLLDLRNQIRRQGLEAARSQKQTFTLELDLAPQLRSRVVDYLEALDEADELCAAEKLLVTPASPAQIQFRRWKLSRIINHLSQ